MKINVNHVFKKLPIAYNPITRPIPKAPHANTKLLRIPTKIPRFFDSEFFAML